MQRFAAVLALVVIPVPCAAQDLITLPHATTWDVEWKNPEGHLYTGELRIELQKGRWIEGSILWTLRASPRAEEQGKIGLTGTEYIRGEYQERTGQLTFEGVRLEDPNSILGTDKYQLTVDSTASNLTGKTSHGDTWTGVFTAKRKG